MNNDEMIERLEYAAAALAKDESDFILEGKPASARQAADALTDVVSVVEALKQRNRDTPSSIESPPDAATDGEEPSSPLPFAAHDDTTTHATARGETPVPEASDTRFIDVEAGQATKKIVLRAAGGAATLEMDDEGVFALFLGDEDDALPDGVLEGSVAPEVRFAYATDKHDEQDAYALVDRQAGPYDPRFVVYGTIPELPAEN